MIGGRWPAARDRMSDRGQPVMRTGSDTDQIGWPSLGGRAARSGYQAFSPIPDVFVFAQIWPLAGL